MPTYIFHDTETDVIFEETMRIAEREEFLRDNPHIKQVPNVVPTIAGIAGVTHKTDDGWKETLSRISEANPYTPLGISNKKKTGKEVATENAVKKWREKRAKALGG